MDYPCSQLLPLPSTTATKIYLDYSGKGFFVACIRSRSQFEARSMAGPAGGNNSSSHPRPSAGSEFAQCTRTSSALPTLVWSCCQSEQGLLAGSLDPSANPVRNSTGHAKPTVVTALSAPSRVDATPPGPVDIPEAPNQSSVGPRTGLSCRDRVVDCPGRVVWDRRPPATRLVWARVYNPVPIEMKMMKSTRGWPLRMFGRALPRKAEVFAPAPHHPVRIFRAGNPLFGTSD